MDEEPGQAPSTTGEISGQGGDPIHDLSIKMVERASHKIVQLIQMFEEQHGMMYFPRSLIDVIYECGVVLLKEAAAVPFAATKKRATALEASRACLRALKGASQTWPWAEHLAGQLQERLSEAGANITIQPFASNWTASCNESEQTGTDMSQTFYQFVHIWDPTGAESSGRGNPTNRTSEIQPTQPRPEISTDSSGAGLPSQMGLGLQGLPPPHQDFGSPAAIRSNLGEAGTVRADADARSYDMMSFSGTPSSSASPYCLPSQAQQETDEKMWDSAMFQ